MVIAVDFDGTIVENKYPKIGKELPFAVETLRMLAADRHRLILWTVREGKLLDEAVAWCKEHGIEFYAVNKDFQEEDEEHNRHYSRKIKAEMFIDDRNVGGMLSWGEIYHLVNGGNTTPYSNRESGSSSHKAKKKKWWQL